MYSKEEFENLINNSPLFDVDKDASLAQYKVERYTFLTLLTDYYRLYIFKNKPLDSYSLTLMETAMECIKYYNKNKGEFLHLFNSSLKRDLAIANAKELIDERRKGIKLSTSNDELIRKIMKYATSKNLDVYDDDVQCKVAELLNISLEKVKELIFVNNDAVGVSSLSTNEDGDEIELYDMVVSNDLTPEEKLIAENSIIELVNDIENTFIEIQERQKKIISLLLTVEVIIAFDYDIKKTVKILNGKKLFNYSVVRYYEKNGELPTARQIASICGVSEQSLSRTYKNFKEKLR